MVFDEIPFDNPTVWSRRTGYTFKANWWVRFGERLREGAGGANWIFIMEIKRKKLDKE